MIFYIKICFRDIFHGYLLKGYIRSILAKIIIHDLLIMSLKYLCLTLPILCHYVDDIISA